MTVEDLRTIAGMMNNDCSKGEVRIFWKTQRHYHCGQWTGADKVENNSLVWIQWDAPGMATKQLGTFRAGRGGYPEQTEIVETIDGGMVQKYFNMVKWFSI